MIIVIVDLCVRGPSHPGHMGQAIFFDSHLVQRDTDSSKPYPLLSHTQGERHAGHHGVCNILGGVSAYVHHRPLQGELKRDYTDIMVHFQLYKLGI